MVQPRHATLQTPLQEPSSLPPLSGPSDRSAAGGRAPLQRVSRDPTQAGPKTKLRLPCVPACGGATPEMAPIHHLLGCGLVVLTLIKCSKWSPDGGLACGSGGFRFRLSKIAEESPKRWDRRFRFDFDETASVRFERSVFRGEYHNLTSDTVCLNINIESKARASCARAPAFDQYETP